METEEQKGPNLVEALMFLARYYKAQMRFEDAEFYCTRFLDYPGPVSFYLTQKISKHF